MTIIKGFAIVALLVGGTWLAAANRVANDCRPGQKKYATPTTNKLPAATNRISKQIIRDHM